MDEAFSRTRHLFGDAAMARLAAARVAVFGIGGVGGYVVEVLARSGVGAIDLFDDDRVAPSNLNRQLIATRDTIGKYKVDAAAARIAAINPACKVVCHHTFFLPENAHTVDFTAYDYIVDAIDTVAGKLALVEKATEVSVPIISCMGAGNKLDPTAFRVADIAATTVCPLARVMRKELKKRGIEHLKVVYSTEPPLAPLPPAVPEEGGDTRPAQKHAKPTPGSNAFVPAAAGIILGGEVVKDLACIFGKKCV